MDSLKAVVSLGHEALGVNTNEQMNATRNAARALADLVEAVKPHIATIQQAVFGNLVALVEFSGALGPAGEELLFFLVVSHSRMG